MKNIVKTIAFVQVILGIAACVFAFRFGFTVEEVRGFEHETQKSLHETAVVVEGTHGVYGNSSKNAVEAVKNIKGYVPALKNVGWKMNGLSKIPLLDIKEECGTPLVEFACNVDDFCEGLTNYYEVHNEQNIKAIRQTASTLRSASDRLGRNPFSGICNMIQNMCFLLSAVLIVNGIVIMCGIKPETV